MHSLFTQALVASVLLLSAVAAETENYGLGRTAPKPLIRAQSISVAPDGTGLPAGRGNAVHGKSIYESQCAGCHGMRGEGIGDLYPPLAGGIGTLKNEKPMQTVGSFWPYATTVWDYINRAMPYQAPGTLTADEVYAVTAYVLYLNGITSERQMLDARSLPRVRMPNREGFIDDPRPLSNIPSGTAVREKAQ